MADGLFGPLLDKYRNSVDMRPRIYGESLLKSFTGNTQSPINKDSFTKNELENLDKLISEHYKEKLSYFTRPKKELLQEATDLEKSSKDILDYMKTLPEDKKEAINRAQNNSQLYLTQSRQLREAAEGKIPSDFAFGYSGYGDRTGQNKYTNDPAGWAQTLGRFRYTVDPVSGEYKVTDKYDFNNEVHKAAAEEYSKMSPSARLGNSLANTFLQGDQYSMGEAYLSGKNAVPVDIQRRLALENNKSQLTPGTLKYQDPFKDTTKD